MDRLTSQVHSLDEQIALHDALCGAQAQETKALKEALSEASMELEVIEFNYYVLLSSLNFVLLC